MQISMVKKIKEDGSPCKKCAEIEKRLKKAGLMDRIDQVIIADERDQQSEGMQLAAKYKVERAPFFIVEEESVAPRIYTVYFQFLKEVLNSNTSEQEEINEIMDQHPDVDFI
ncbi:MAG: hypothetical protein V3V89_05840 [Gammaproteobacteria bacterium]